MESIQLSITGMKCGGCVSTVEKILNNSEGIENVSVNLLTESAYFEISHNKVKIEKILENLEENGFPSKIYINDFSKKINKAELEKNKNLSKNFRPLAKDIALFGTKKTKGTFANKIIDQYKNSKKLFIITVVPNQIYCLAGYWIEEISPGKFESIFYEKTKQKINEYKNTKKEVDKIIKGINLEYKSIKKEINDFY